MSSLRSRPAEKDSSNRDDEWQERTFWAPQIDVQRRGDAIVVRADLPGVRKEDVQVEVQGDALVLSGQRTVPLPQGTNADKIEAVMRDGVLKVTLPLAESARPKKIQIQT